MSTAFFMGTRIHHLFTDMMDRMPPEALLKAIKLEGEMLENDLFHHRIRKTHEVTSILSFCSFVEAAEAGWEFPQIKLPMEDITCYRKIIRRLVDNRILPASAKCQFDFAFFLTFLEGVADH